MANDEKQMSKTQDKIELAVRGMTCAACSARIEKQLTKAKGVVKASVNLASEKATVKYVPGIIDKQHLIKIIEKTGYGAKEISDSENDELRQDRLVKAYKTELYFF